jgi:hypothetical protein
MLRKLDAEIQRVYPCHLRLANKHSQQLGRAAEQVLRHVGLLRKEQLLEGSCSTC